MIGQYMFACPECGWKVKIPTYGDSLISIEPRPNDILERQSVSREVWYETRQGIIKDEINYQCSKCKYEMTLFAYWRCDR